jgi:hypothetical protein
MYDVTECYGKALCFLRSKFNVSRTFTVRWYFERFEKEVLNKRHV